LQDLTKFTQIGIFGSKLCHLATLIIVKLEAEKWTEVTKEDFENEIHPFLMMRPKP
jgi:hypothetical protein